MHNATTTKMAKGTARKIVPFYLPKDHIVIKQIAKQRDWYSPRLDRVNYKGNTAYWNLLGLVRPNMERDPWI